MRLRSLGVLAAATALAAAYAAETATASEPFSDRNVSDAQLEVNGAGEALVTYRRTDGRVRRVLVWGAIDARHPDPNVPQVRFRYDYAGGFGKYGRAIWRSFRDGCGPYTGPALPFLVAACAAPDGSFWALQAWQRRLPLLGVLPFRPGDGDIELHVSHWSGPLALLEVWGNWTYGGVYEGLFGRLTYLGMPVHGFAATRDGNPRDRYGRNLYIDTLNSGYGPGWQRKAAILAHRARGTFCHSFVPQAPPPGYPSQEVRPASPGERHRVVVSGPGVTPVLAWEGPRMGPYDPARDEEVNSIFDRVMAGDTTCAPER
jgi:hypothetical protein